MTINSDDLALTKCNGEQLEFYPLGISPVRP